MPNVDTRLLDTRINTALDEKLASFGGGGNNEGMTAWQQSVENRLSQLHADLKDLGSKVDRQLLFMIGGFASILGVMAKGFGWF